MYFVTFFTVALTVSLASAQIDVSGCANATAAINKCNMDNGIDPAITVPSGFVFALLTKANTYCGTNQDKFKTAAGCVVDVVRGCGKDDFPTLYPTASSLQSGIDAFCSNKDDIGASCVDLTQLGTCLTGKIDDANLTTPSSGASFSVVKTYYCQSATFAAECAETNAKLTDCTKTKTKEVYAEMVGYTKPEACGAMTNWILVPNITTKSVTMSLASAQINIGGCANATDNIAKCNTDNSISPAINIPLTFVTKILEDPNTNCGNKDKFKMAAGCVVGVVRGCGKDDFPKLYPTASSLQSGIDAICSNKDDIDGSCVDLNQIGVCATNKRNAANLTTPASNAAFSVFKNYYCQSATFIAACAEEDTKLTGCTKTKTKEVFAEVAGYLTPEACGAMTTFVTSVLLVASLFISFANNLI